MATHVLGGMEMDPSDMGEEMEMALPEDEMKEGMGMTMGMGMGMEDELEMAAEALDGPSDGRKRLKEGDDGYNPRKQGARARTHAPYGQGGSDWAAQDPSRDHYAAGGQDGSVSLKLLCPYGVSGSLIGPRGTVMNEIRSTTGARIKLSQSSEFFPGTQDRIVLVSGQVHEVHGAIDSIVRRVIQALSMKDTDVSGQASPNDPYAAATPSRSSRRTMRILIPASASGVIIGRGGSVVKSLSESTNSKISLSQKDQAVPLSERIVTITADSDENIIMAIQAVMNQLLSDPSGGRYSNMSTAYGTHAGGSTLPPNVRAAVAAAAAAAGAGGSAATTTVQIPVNEAYIGSIIGRGGCVKQEIMAYSGARLQVSQKGEYLQGTQERIVSVTGTAQAVQLAQYLISEKVASAVMLAQQSR